MCLFELHVYVRLLAIAAGDKRQSAVTMVLSDSHSTLISGHKCVDNDLSCRHCVSETGWGNFRGGAFGRENAFVSVQHAKTCRRQFVVVHESPTADGTGPRMDKTGIGKRLHSLAYAALVAKWFFAERDTGLADLSRRCG